MKIGGQQVNTQGKAVFRTADCIHPGKLTSGASRDFGFLTFMKTNFFAAVFFSLPLVLTAQTGRIQSQPPTSEPPQDTSFAIVQRDANSRVWEGTRYEKGPSGEMIPHLSRYTEIATGMNYQQGNQWVESSEKIEILRTGGASAVHGQHQIYFPADIYDGAIEIVTADGKHLKSRPMAISYYDGANSVLIAELKHSVGLLLPSGNQVIYTNAFTDFAADLVCTYRKSGFESDLVFREQPLGPGQFGLNPNARLELWTEFFESPEPAQIRSDAADPTLSPDQTLKFGAMTMIRGKAFSVSNDADVPSPSAHNSVLVGKSWEHIGGRTFLIEEVPAPKIAAQLKTLPASAAPVQTASSDSVLHKISSSRLLVPSRIIQKVPEKALVANDEPRRSIQLANADPTQKAGVVLDYYLVNSLQTNFTFQGDTTYYISSGTQLFGSNVIEGGAVLKFAASTTLHVPSTEQLICATAPYRPAILTAADDNSVGEQIAGSTNPPSGYYVGLTLDEPCVLQNLRVAYPSSVTLNGSPAVISDCQFVNFQSGFTFGSGGTADFNNVLIDNVPSTVFYNSSTLVRGANLTVHAVSNLFTTLNTNLGKLILTNSLIVYATNLGNSFTGTFNVVTNDATAFQKMGAGFYYLATNSAYRNAGTTNIASTLLADLRQKTTYPPILYSNIAVSINTTLSPQAQRDTDTLDLGYHYDPIDYLVALFWVTNSLTLTNGVVVAGYNDQDIALTEGSAVISIGTPLQPNWLTRYSCVQEQPLALGRFSPGDTDLINTWHTNIAPSANFRFTKFSCPARSGYQLYDGLLNFAYANLSVQDCEFWGGQFELSGYNSTSISFKNTLLVRPAFVAASQSYTNNSLIMSNNLFWNGSMMALPSINSNSWSFFNNAFDHTTNLVVSRGRVQYYLNGNNAYIGDTNITVRLSPMGLSDVVLTNFSYQSGPLGTFYQPTNSALINTGSVTADLTGLYHYTTTTNQVKETNSIVDIGYHYVALDSLGNAMDTDGDGIPDYLEDANGNGLVDGGETSWILSPYNGLTFGNGLQVFTPLK